MTISVFDIFKIGIGPSSSHTVGPMRAARAFVEALEQHGTLSATRRIGVRLYGSLALTGRGHCTDRAVLMGLEGERPETVVPERVEHGLDRIRCSGRIRLAGTTEIDFDEALDLLFLEDQVLPFHANGMRFTALAADRSVCLEETYYSIGGGFVVREQDTDEAGDRGGREVAHPFADAAELLAGCGGAGLRIDELVLANERAWRSDDDTRAGLLEIWQAMRDCTCRGLETPGVLPGGLGVRRRAPDLHRELAGRYRPGAHDVLDWVTVWALAVNEENAAGGRVVTAPTNGAAGIIPAVLHYYERFCESAGDEGIVRFLLTAGAIAMLYKKNASISGAEMGCQGEVGVACSMAAAGLAAALGGTPAVVENAAEIGMEHNLGLTCDPVRGLVQIPCIERNAMGAVKAINAARLAMRGDGRHVVTLDQVIATMRQTGQDMSSSYKETSQGGLAVNVIEC